MYKAFKYRLYPTPAQEVLIAKHIGACRFVYNLALETKQMAYSMGVNLSRFDLQAQLPELKKECPWLREIGSGALQVSIMHLDRAYNGFFTGKASFPAYKKKEQHGKFLTYEYCQIKEGKIRICKFRKGIKIKQHRPIEGKIISVSIERTNTGKYFASIICDTGSDSPIKSQVIEVGAVGVDLGLKSFLVTSGGQTIDNPKFMKNAQARLKFVQRKYSNHKGKRTRNRLVLLHEKVANQRKDFLHKTSSMLVKNHDSIAIEDLNVKGMLQNHKLAGSISDVGWSEFVRQIEYKAEWYGKNILKIGRFDPSSKTCSCCGAINKDLTLSQREWTCVCGVTHDRDLNAAINIKNFALSRTDRENRGELPELSGVLTHEASLRGSSQRIVMEEKTAEEYLNEEG